MVERQMLLEESVATNVKLTARSVAEDATIDCIASIVVSKLKWSNHRNRPFRAVQTIYRNQIEVPIQITTSTVQACTIISLLTIID